MLESKPYARSTATVCGAIFHHSTLAAAVHATRAPSVGSTAPHSPKSLANDASARAAARRDSSARSHACCCAGAHAHSLASLTAERAAACHVCRGLIHELGQRLRLMRRESLERVSTRVQHASRRSRPVTSARRLPPCDDAARAPATSFMRWAGGGAGK